MADLILSLLSDTKLRALVVNAFTGKCIHARKVYEISRENMQAAEGENLWKKAWWQAKTSTGVDVEKAFEEHVFAKVPRPFRITLQETLDAFWAVARPSQCGLPDDALKYAEGAYAAFLNFVANRLLSDNISVPFTVARVDLCHLSPFAEYSDGIRSVPSGIPDDPALWLTDELARILPSIIRSAVVRALLIAGHEPDAVICCERRLPVITRVFLGKSLQFVRRCLDARFCRPIKKDSLDRRIQNAVNLLVESDMQSNDALGLALSIAAIEALLGEKGTRVSERLSINLAVLLEPRPDMRARAKTFFSNLYASRSDALHGQLLNDVQEQRNHARCVGASVLHSVISRQNFLLHGGFDPEQPDDLLHDLKDLHWSAGQPMGVSPLPIVKLWREP